MRLMLSHLTRLQVLHLSLLAAATIVLALGATAQADLSFCPPGSGAGQCEKPQGLAVDNETGDLFVADQGNNRINVFESDGDFLRAFGWGVADGVTNALQVCTITCFKGIAGSGAGQFSSPTRVAVDNSGGPSQGDVYVGTDNFRVQKFSPAGSFLLSFGKQGSGECELSRQNDPIAVGPGGVVYIADSRETGEFTWDSKIKKFDSSGACIGDVALPKSLFSKALAVDSSGNIYVPWGFGGGLCKYDPSGTELYCLDLGAEIHSVAVDKGDNLFSAHREFADMAQATFQVVAEYDSSGNPLRRFGYDDIQSFLSGLAVHHSAAGDVFGSEGGGGFSGEISAIRYLAEPPPGPIIAPASVEAAQVGNAKATLKAEINPEGKASTYRFEYLSQKDFEDQGNSFTGPATKSAEGTLSDTGFNLKAVEAVAGCPNPLTELAEEKCLKPETTYRFRVIAENPDGEGNGLIEGGTFTTKPPLEILATYATEVGTETATLSAQVNPLSIPASGYFEYVEDAAFQKSGFAEAIQLPNVDGGEGEVDFGAANTPTIRTVNVFPLKPGITYHYRVVITNPLIEPITGPEHSFTTFAKPAELPPCPANEAFRLGAAGLLPDCRAYELVSPLDKNSGDIKAPVEFTTGLPAVLEQSSLTGQKLAYGSYKAFGDAQSGAYTSQYIARRDPQREEWVTHAITPPRGRLLNAAAIALDTDFRFFSPDLCTGWLRTVAEPPLAPGAVKGFANLYRRTDSEPECGGQSYEAITRIKPPGATDPLTYKQELQGVSANGETSIYVANAELIDGAPSPGLYWKRGTQTTSVCVLPDGSIPPKGCSAGTAGLISSGASRGASIENAISTDGERVFFSIDPNSAVTLGPIYLRERPGEKQSQVAEGKCTQPTKACTIAVSAKAEELSGTKASIFWTAADDGSRAIFTTGEGVHSDLYEFDVETETTTLIAGKSPGLLGSSEDAKWLYLASEEVLSGPNAEGEAPIEGKPNLYLRHDGSFSFIATLAAADIFLGDEFGFGAIGRQPIKRAARVSPDGRFAAFTSQASIGGYDNADASSGKADAEIYLYDAEAKELVCASCNPSGARPAGRDLIKGNFDFWAAAQIPVWENNLYAPRVLSGDGKRLYFESTDALVLRDTNGAQDVYQWEAVGSGDCAKDSPAFSEPNGGCLSLISSGQSPRDSEFVDANPNAGDVFFSTLSSLLPQDYGLIDIYDAKAGGGLPPPPLPAPPCEGEACQNPAGAPNDQTPASASFRGEGNPVTRKASKARCAKGNRKVRRAGKSRCVKKRQRR